MANIRWTAAVENSPLWDRKATDMSARSVTIQPASVSGRGCKQRLEYDGFVNPLWEAAKDKTQISENGENAKIVKKKKKKKMHAWHEPFCGNSPGVKMMISWKRPPSTHTPAPPPPTPTNQSTAPHLLCLPVAWQRNVTASPACDWSAAFLGSPTHNALRAQSKHAFLLQHPPPPPPAQPPPTRT